MSEPQQLAEHSASRPPDLQIPKAEVDSASQRRSRARRALQINPYIDSFDEEPLPFDVAEQVFARVLDIVAYAEDLVCRGAADQIQALNKVAGVELIRPSRSIFSL